MDVGRVVELVRRVDAVDGSSLASVVAAVVDARRGIAWFEARQVELARMLGSLSSFPEKELADANRTGLAPAMNLIRRVDATSVFPSFAAALNAGEISGGYVDAVGKALIGLEAEHRSQLVAQDDQLAYTASHSTLEEFHKVLAQRVRVIEADGGMGRFERQQRNTRLRSWIDHATGMFHLSGQFDPVSGTKLDARLRAMVNTLYVDTVPASCPTDTSAKQDHLRALALVALIDGQRARVGRPEIVVVVDTTQPAADGRPLVDWGLPVEIPMRVLTELADTADMHTVVVRNGVIVHAPGNLDLGRHTRIANRAQRRALRAVHRGCVIPGCGVRFDYCKIHHIRWWRNGGSTTLDNLVPVCEQHHHTIHDNGWHIQLATDRTITITLPDNTQLAQPPPDRWAG